MPSWDRFEWDVVKAATNRSKHGIDFEFGTRVFLDEQHVEIDVSRERDGERRTKAIGIVDRSLFTIVFAPRGDVCRVISVRRSNKSEEKAYGDRPLQT
jgi:uncharacterized DUF497 family protein